MATNKGCLVMQRGARGLALRTGSAELCLDLPGRQSLPFVSFSAIGVILPWLLGILGGAPDGGIPL